jgi:hypothetical protein
VQQFAGEGTHRRHPARLVLSDYSRHLSDVSYFTLQ